MIAVVPYVLAGALLAGALLAGALLAGALLAGPMIEPECDARIIARHAPTMSKADSLEVIDVMEAEGGLGAKDADDYRELIEEAYREENLKDLDAWARRRCDMEEA